MGTARCHDCGVAPGFAHHSGCDVERCALCGDQRLFCPCVDSRPHTIWTGEFPGTEEARAQGWWARRTPAGWQPCPPNTAGARPDLNRLAFHRQHGFDGLYSAEELAGSDEPANVELDRDDLE